MSTKLDPFLNNENVSVEPEDLLEPELETPKGRPTAFGRLRVRLGRYGNGVLGSGRRFLEVTSETLSNIGTALAGSIILLPLVIVARGLSVLTHGLIDLIKPLLLSIIRALLDALRAIVWPLHEVFVGFNKNVLYPLIKRIRDDDMAALVAFVVLIAFVGGIIFLLTYLL